MANVELQMQFTSQQLADAVPSLVSAVSAAGGRALIVGGCVRDAALGQPAKDVDIEVYGVAPDRLVSALEDRFRIDLVGQAFAVVKIKGLPIDVSIPRRESNAGIGHKGFAVQSDSIMLIEEAVRRRDFTVNAMAFDTLSRELIDPFGGMRDLRGGILRHTSDQFAEDPLRVLRAMQFAARFDFSVASATVELCRTIEIEDLPEERVFDEWKKLIIKGRTPSRGLRFLRECEWIRYFPELEALIGCQQDPAWHPEGDVWTHTLHVMDAFARERVSDEWEDLVVGLGCLCHDFGKPGTTAIKHGRICAHGHERAGVEPARSFLQRLTRQVDVIAEVLPLVRDHLKPVTLYEQNAGYAAIRRLSLRVGRIDRLVRVTRADRQGRPPQRFDGFPEGEWLLARAQELHVADEKPQSLILGRHLIELGLEPGPHFGPILDACFEGQLDGVFSDVEEGVEYARKLVKQSNGLTPSRDSMPVHSVRPTNGAPQDTFRLRGSRHGA